MTDTSNGIKTAQAEYPLAMHSCVKKRAEPKQFREIGLVPDKLVERFVSHLGDLAGTKCRHIMVQTLQWISMKIDKVTRYMHRNQLTDAFPIIHIATNEAFNQIGANRDRLF